jgi:hypothetical protein
VRAVSCRVAAHETASIDDCGGGVGINLILINNETKLFTVAFGLSLYI